MGNVYSKQFVNLCRHGKFTKAKEFYQDNADKVDIHANNEEAFRSSCKYGNVKFAKWLIEISKMNINPLHEQNRQTYEYTSLPTTEYIRPINIHANNEEGFIWCCKYGHLEMAKWLYNLGFQKNEKRINIHACEEYAFYSAFNNSHKHIIEWLSMISNQPHERPILLLKDNGHPVILADPYQ